MPRGFCRCDRRRHHGGGNGFRSEPAHPVWFPRARRRTACVRFGYIGSTTFDPDRLLAAIVAAVGSDRVDLIDLTRAGAQLRFRAAGDGRPLLEADPGAFSRFWLDAVSFWCDVEPIVRAGYDQVLTELGP